MALASPLILFVALAALALVLSTPPADILKELHQEDTRLAVLISLRTTLIATILVGVFGTFFALAIHRAIPALSSALEFLITIPAILPPSVAGLALLLAFGRRGLLGPWLESHGISVAFTGTAVVMAQVFVSAPFFVREASNAFKSIDPDLVAAARLDGASALRISRWIYLPLATPFLATGLILAWTRALGEFGATIMFAGNLSGTTQTMPLAIYLGFESDLGEAKALAVLLLLIAVGVLLLVRVALGRRMSFAH
jgi:molybdate transport system permease protein